MNSYLLAASVLAVIVGVVHSVLGEWMIFRRMRVSGLVPTRGGSVLREFQVRILWATWHVATAMGLGVAAILFWLAQPSSAAWVHSMVTTAVIGAMGCSSVLVFVGTRGRHPGWIGLLGVAVLTGLAAYT